MSHISKGASRDVMVNELGCQTFISTLDFCWAFVLVNLVNVNDTFIILSL